MSRREDNLFALLMTLYTQDKEKQTKLQRDITLQLQSPC